MSARRSQMSREDWTELTLLTLLADRAGAPFDETERRLRARYQRGPCIDPLEPASRAEVGVWAGLYICARAHHVWDHHRPFAEGEAMYAEMQKIALSPASATLRETEFARYAIDRGRVARGLEMFRRILPVFQELVARGTGPDPAYKHFIHAEEVVALQRVLSGDTAVEELGSGGFFDDRTPLMWAAWRGDLDGLAAAAAADPRIDLVDEGGRSAVHWAVLGGSPEAVRWLAAHGADLEMPTVAGATPLEMSAATGMVEVAITLLEMGAHPDPPSGVEATPLVGAIRALQTDLLAALLQAGADPSRRVYGLAPVHYAAWAGHTEGLRLLLDLGIDPNTRCDTGMDGCELTPLILAAHSNWPDVARLLLSHGADPELQNVEGARALDYAEESWDSTTRDILLESRSGAAGL